MSRLARSCRFSSFKYFRFVSGISIRIVHGWNKNELSGRCPHTVTQGLSKWGLTEIHTKSFHRTFTSLSPQPECLSHIKTFTSSLAAVASSADTLSRPSLTVATLCQYLTLYSGTMMSLFIRGISAKRAQLRRPCRRCVQAIFIIRTV
jgi:hypothetical protein